MNHHIILREYQKSDCKLLEDVVRETWNYDRFCTPKTAAKLASVYLSSCLANQTFTQVALMNDTPVGIIMVKNRKKHKGPFGFAIKRAASIISLLCSKEGRTVSRIFECVETIDQELLCQCKTDYQGELAFFAVSQTCRGKGVGKALFEKALEYMREEHICNFYLFTDTSCNYGFYEHQGMERQQEKKHSFYINGQQEEMTFFIYDHQTSHAQKIN